MNNLLTIIGFIFSFGLSISMLYLRMKSWLNNTIKNIISISFAAIGIIGFQMTNKNDFRFLFYSMTVPILSILFYLLFKKLSIKYQGRDFYLYLRSSYDLDKHDKDFSALDILFSFTILIIIIGIETFGAVLFGHDDLYNKWIMN